MATHHCNAISKPKLSYPICWEFGYNRQSVRYCPVLQFQRSRLTDFIPGPKLEYLAVYGRASMGEW